MIVIKCDLKTGRWEKSDGKHLLYDDVQDGTKLLAVVTPIKGTRRTACWRLELCTRQAPAGSRGVITESTLEDGGVYPTLKEAKVRGWNDRSLLGYLLG
jgi:hypothetical protein